MWKWGTFKSQPLTFHTSSDNRLQRVFLDQEESAWYIVNMFLTLKALPFKGHQVQGLITPPL